MFEWLFRKFGKNNGADLSVLTDAGERPAAAAAVSFAAEEKKTPELQPAEAEMAENNAEQEAAGPETAEAETAESESESDAETEGEDPVVIEPENTEAEPETAKADGEAAETMESGMVLTGADADSFSEAEHEPVEPEMTVLGEEETVSETAGAAGPEEQGPAETEPEETVETEKSEPEEAGAEVPESETPEVKGTEPGAAAAGMNEPAAAGTDDGHESALSRENVVPGKKKKEKKHERQSLYDRSRPDKKKSGKGKKKKKAGTLKVRDLVLGEGLPAICVPLTGETRKELLLQASWAVQAKADLVEWRADHFDDLDDPGAMAAMLASLREAIGSLPLLFTVRTHPEGGELPYSAEEYERLLRWAVSQSEIDLIDIEFLHYDLDPSEWVDSARRSGMMTVASAHFFRGTPEKAELRQVFARGEQTGADILKVAAMPEKPKDVLRLMRVTQQVREETGRILITMSMGEMGKISRVSGALTGSAVTFGTAGPASAPGQIPAEELRMILHALQED